MAEDLCICEGWYDRSSVSEECVLSFEGGGFVEAGFGFSGRAEEELGSAVVRFPWDEIGGAGFEYMGEMKIWWGLEGEALTLNGADGDDFGQIDWACG